MKNVVCFSHPEYNPMNPPDLTCRLCCQKYIAKIKENQEFFKSQKSYGQMPFTSNKGKRASKSSGIFEGNFYPGSI